MSGSDDMQSSSDAEEEIKSKKRKISHVKKSTDVDEGKTIFIRNLNYTTEEEALEGMFTKFGDIVYAKIVKDNRTEHSKGMAFVKFKNKEDADDALLKSSEPENEKMFTLDKRRLNLCMAVSRDQSKGLRKQEPTRQEKRTTRNLHLAPVGMIRPGTKEAAGMSKADLSKREDIMKSKKEKLRNPEIFVSPLRLCVRNIPATVDDKTLRQKFEELVGGKDRIRECRIMRDLNRLNAKGVAKSRGYAFIAFEDHEDAMKALKETNNSAVFGMEKRLIVEFSLENTKALLTKKRREEKSQQKVSISRGEDNKKPQRLPDIKPDAVRPSPGQLKTLPRHFGAKNRYRNRGLKANKARPPKGKISRKESRKRKGGQQFVQSQNVPSAKRRKKNK